MAEPERLPRSRRNELGFELPTTPMAGCRSLDAVTQQYQPLADLCGTCNPEAICAGNDSGDAELKHDPLRIAHVTLQSLLVSLCQNVAHLSARDCARQQAEPPLLSITPDPAVIEERIDFFGNPVHYFTIQEPHRDLTVRFECRIGVRSEPHPEPSTTPSWESVRDRMQTDRAWLDPYQFAFDSRYAAADAMYAQYASDSFAPGRPILEAALDLMRRIHAEFAYDPSATSLALRSPSVREPPGFRLRPPADRLLPVARARAGT